jgi:hypothetical protein
MTERARPQDLPTTAEASPRHEDSSNALRGRSLLLARSAWVAMAAVVLGLNAAGIPYAYALYQGPCTGAACVDDSLRLTPEDIQSLREVGISPEFYAAYAGVGIKTVVTLVFFTVAAVIFWRRSEDRMALFGSFMLLVFGGAAISGAMHDLAEVHPVFWFPVSLLNYIGQVSFGLFFYLFPDGRFVPRWTRWLAVAAALMFVVSTFFAASSLSALTDPLFFVFIGSLVFAQIYRYRRVSTPTQRQQTKWVVFGFSVALTGFLGTLLIGALLIYQGVTAAGSGAPTGLLRDTVGVTIVYGFLLLIPLSIGVAILRSRLYDIDVVINRTLVYGALTALLGTVYVGSVVALQYLSRALTGGDSQLAVVASTLAIAALFGPLRRNFQAFIDRGFYRKKYDAGKILEAFSAKLRDETDLDALNEELARVTGETVQPAYYLSVAAPGTREGQPGHGG